MFPPHVRNGPRQSALHHQARVAKGYQRPRGVGRPCVPPQPNAAGRRPGLFIRSGVGRAATEGGVCRRASLRRQACEAPARQFWLQAGSRCKQRPASRGGTSARGAARFSACLVTRPGTRPWTDFSVWTTYTNASRAEARRARPSKPRTGHALIWTESAPRRSYPVWTGVGYLEPGGIEPAGEPVLTGPEAPASPAP
jgi:hypothetical protein